MPAVTNSRLSRQGDVRPRGSMLPFDTVTWPVTRSFGLGNVVPPMPSNFMEVLETRSSERHLSRAPLREVANLLLVAAAARHAWGVSPRRSLRPSHSAGAIHPLSVLVVRSGPKPRILRLDPFAARIEFLRPERPKRLVDLVDAASRIVPSAAADILVLAADPAVPNAIYEEAVSLVWRDAGALMQTIHLCATAFRLGLCPMGILGHEALEAVFGDSTALFAAGSAVVGRPITHP
ncbi:nitroreductase family protein [Methylobacterium flocculans]|uniref:nitroreductase family protein n=1 Tax=Methylobacterium flocculans TaxID=2984843 RepID=UPI0021F26810|nr:nitroreductase family protein [Methylobacterium sp. FF17]